MDKYQILHPIAQALYGDIVLVQYKGTNWAMKRMSKSCMKRKITQRGHHRISEDALVELEMNTHLQQHPHPHILPMVEAFESHEAWHAVFEYCGRGELFAIVQEAEQLEVERATKYMHQIALAVHHLHALGFAHRDISLENILVTESDACKLCDFGLVSSLSTERQDFVGKSLYMAPEIIRRDMYNPAQVDVWSLGVVFFILLTGMPPFDEASDQDKSFQFVKRFGIKRLIQVWHVESCFSNGMLHLIQNMLQIDPAKRYTMEQVVDHLAHCPIIAVYEKAPVPSCMSMSIRSPQICKPLKSKHAWRRLLDLIRSKLAKRIKPQFNG